MIQWTNQLVTKLEPNEVFVFGSNEQGFHGAGAAGLACRGDSRNNWRNDQWFMGAINDTEDRKGVWAEFGVGRGYQEGTHGRSYAIATVTKPGWKKSISRRDIYKQLVELWQFIAARPTYIFFVTPLGEGYAGWSRSEMDEVWSYLVEKMGLPTNVRFVGRNQGVQTT